MYDATIGLNKLVDFFSEDTRELLSKDTLFHHNGGRPMMHSAEEHRKQERAGRQKKETIPNSVKAAMPASSGVRRHSDGKFVGRPLSRHGKRPPSSKSLDSDITMRTNENDKASQEGHFLYQRPQQDEKSLLLRQHSNELISSHGSQFVPRPPSRQREQGRPISAKGRVRPGPHVRRENKGSGEASPQISSHPPLKSQSSFSKYTPLPSIGTGLLPELENYHVSSDSQVKRKNNDDADNFNHLLQSTAGLSIQHTLPNEPSETEPGRIHLAVKLLDGSRHERWFRNTETLGAVMAFAASLSKDKLPPCQFCTNEVPRRIFDDFSLSLSQAEIHSRTVLHLEEKED
ncbi:UBX domain-containing protein 10-like [Montipora capricornis]|uniref:UBX domain-containing protein 10-like n=1 Tax=Montipora capricornis TaxID=246305 RepID=UPI0035F12EE5